MSNSPTILITGSYGTKNLGDSKILDGLTHLCREYYSDPEVIATSIEPSETVERTSVDQAIPTIERDLFNWLREIRNIDLIILGGGSVINHPHFCIRHSIIVSIAYVLNINIYVTGGAGHSYGITEKATYHYLNLVDSLTVRDPQSREIVRSLGVEEPVDVVPDPGLVSINSENIEEFNIPDNYVIVSLRPVHRGSVDVSGIASALDDFNKSHDYEILFFPFQIGGGKDIDFSKVVMGEMETESIIIDRSYTIGQAELIIDHADAVVGMRLHSIILSAHLRTPFTAISYGVKCRAFLEQIGVQNWFVWSDIDEHKLSDSIQDNIQKQTPIPESEEQIRALEEDCSTIFSTFESQSRDRSFTSYLVLVLCIPILLLKYIMSGVLSRGK